MTRVADVVSSRPLRRISNRRVRRELRRATFHAALAARRARRVGPLAAAGDRRVTRGLRRASQHASRAAVFAVNPPPTHRVRNATRIAIGAGSAVVMIVAIRRRPGQVKATEEAPAAPESPSPETSDSNMRAVISGVDDDKLSD